MTSNSARTSGNGGRRFTGKRGAGSLADEIGKEIEERIKSVYNDCWFIYKEYLGSHDMAQYNRRVCELKEKYPEEEFLKDILYGFIKKINTLHARYLMVKDGRLGYKVVATTGTSGLSSDDPQIRNDMINYISKKGREAKKVAEGE